MPPLSRNSVPSGVNAATTTYSTMKLAGTFRRPIKRRQQVLDIAYELDAERFVRSALTPPVVPTEAWINKSSQNVLAERF